VEEISPGGLVRGEDSRSGSEMDVLGSAGMALCACINLGLFEAAMFNKAGSMTHATEEGGRGLACCGWRSWRWRTRVGSTEGEGATACSSSSSIGCSKGSGVDARAVLA